MTQAAADAEAPATPVVSPQPTASGPEESSSSSESYTSGKESSSSTDETDEAKTDAANIDAPKIEELDPEMAELARLAAAAKAKYFAERGTRLKQLVESDEKHQQQMKADKEKNEQQLANMKQSLLQMQVMQEQFKISRMQQQVLLAQEAQQREQAQAAAASGGLQNPYAGANAAAQAWSDWNGGYPQTYGDWATKEGADGWGVCGDWGAAGVAAGTCAEGSELPTEDPHQQNGMGVFNADVVKGGQGGQ